MSRRDDAGLRSPEVAVAGRFEQRELPYRDVVVLAG
jgi:hypothetical protein